MSEALPDTRNTTFCVTFATCGLVAAAWLPRCCLGRGKCSCAERPSPATERLETARALHTLPAQRRTAQSASTPLQRDLAAMAAEPTSARARQLQIDLTSAGDLLLWQLARTCQRAAFCDCCNKVQQFGHRRCFLLPTGSRRRWQRMTSGPVLLQPPGIKFGEKATPMRRVARLLAQNCTAPSPRPGQTLRA